MMSSSTFLLQSPFAPSGDQPEAIKKIVKGLDRGDQYQTILGVTGSGKTFTMASVIAKVNRPTLIMAPNKTLAGQLYNEMTTFFPKNNVGYFVSYYDYYQPEAYVASTDTFIEKDASINEHIEQMRLHATRILLEQNDVVIVATVSAIYGLGDPTLYLSMSLPLKVGQVIDQREVLRHLVQMQYKRNDTELKRGTYRVRGEAIDIYPADEAISAVRVHLFDEEIERIEQFDPLTGECLESMNHLTIFPKSHYVAPKERLMATIDPIKEELQARLEVLRSEDRLVEAQRLKERTQLDLEMMQELGYCSGIENYSRYLSGRGPGEPPPTLMDYLPADALLVVDESHVTVPQIRAMYRGDRARKENLVNYGFRLPSALDNRPLKEEEFWAFERQTLFISATPGERELADSQSVIDLVVRPTGILDPNIIIRPVETQVEDVLSEIHKRSAIGERVLITTLTKKMSENLTEFLLEHGVKVEYLHSDVDTVRRAELLKELRLGTIDVLVGINLLREGLDLPEVSLVAIFDADKQGFLRSARSLIQTIGRAARNTEGMAILYADTITPAMQEAMDETARRREKQEAYNKKHGITPQAVGRAIESLVEVNDEQNEEVSTEETMSDEVVAMSQAELSRKLKALEKAMYQASKDLAFEEAARIRDEMRTLEKQVFRT